MLCCCKNVNVHKSKNQNTNKTSYKFHKMKYKTHGLHSTIFTCEEQNTKTKCICKQINIHKDSFNEINILKQLKNAESDCFPEYIYHKKIDIKTYSIYYRYIPGKDLFQTFFHDYSLCLTLDQIIDLAKKMLTCVIELQKLNLMHIDIKLENFIFDIENDKIYLIDFEGCQKIPPNDMIGNLNSFSTTKNYVPPEIWFRIGHKNTDVWNIGVCLWFFLTKKYPFYTTSIHNLVIAYKNSKYMKKNKRFSDEMERNIINKCKIIYRFPTSDHENEMIKYKKHTKLIEIFAKIFTLEPADRITAEQLLKMISHI